MDLTRLKIKNALLGLERPVVRVESAAVLDDFVIDKIKKTILSIAGTALDVETAFMPSHGSNVVIHFGENLRLNLDIYSLWVKELEKELMKMMEERPFASIAAAGEHIEKIINATEVETVLEKIGDIGRVVEVGDGIAHVRGLRNVGSQELVKFGRN